MDTFWTNLKKQCSELVKKQTNPEEKLFAFWDFDGTILHGDLTEGKDSDDISSSYVGLLEDCTRSGYIPEINSEKSFLDFKKFLDDLLKKDKNLAYFEMARILEVNEESKEKLKKFCYEKIKTNLSKFFYQETVDFMNYIKDLGIEQSIVSLSPELFIKEAAKFLPVKPDLAFGLNPKEDIVMDILQYPKGKSLKIEKIYKSYEELNIPCKTIFAAGNEWYSDGSMIELAYNSGGIGLFIDHKHKRKDIASLDRRIKIDTKLLSLSL